MISIVLRNINKILLFFVTLPIQLYTSFINTQRGINNSSGNNQPIFKNLLNYLSKYLKFILILTPLILYYSQLQYLPVNECCGGINWFCSNYQNTHNQVVDLSSNSNIQQIHTSSPYYESPANLNKLYNTIDFISEEDRVMSGVPETTQTRGPKPTLCLRESLLR